ncbi:hypothetical protein T03_12508 [Trichinella britovi]|uniref:Uncharacterized protein n=1 Tax=Trichinella britovi TaxID=45882 RepID=A0A0V1D877_TRIBR|nr:hypothetical protein T03_12508 [Trichinella britovi]
MTFHERNVKIQASTVCCRSDVVRVSRFEVIWFWSQTCLARLSTTNDEWKFSAIFGCDAISQSRNLAYCRHVFSSTASGNQVEPKKLLSSFLQRLPAHCCFLVKAAVQHAHTTVQYKPIRTINPNTTRHLKAGRIYN